MARDDQSTHYDAGGIETLDIIKAKLSPEQYIGYLLGNSLKYQSRFNFKHAGEGRIRDAEKSANYAQWLRDELAEQKAIREAVSDGPTPPEALEYWDRQNTFP